jgi:hypothetical protein
LRFHSLAFYPLSAVKLFCCVCLPGISVPGEVEFKPRDLGSDRGYKALAVRSERGREGGFGVNSELR